MDALTLFKVRELEIAVRIWNPQASRTIVAWHGLARHGGDFEDLARQLGPEWRTLAPDTPGRGLSSWSLYPAHDYLYAHYMTIAEALLDHFELERVDWVGTSMGGLLGMLLAANATTAGRIERLVLNDVGPELDASGLAALGAYFAVPHRFTRFSELEAELREHYAAFGIEDDSAWRRLALNSARRLPDGSWTHHYDPRIGEQFIHDTPRDMWQVWESLRCPVMVVRGASSTLLGAESIDKMRRLRPDLVSLEVPEAGHAPMLDRPSQVDPIRAFLTRPAEEIDAPPYRFRKRLPWWKRWLRFGRSSR